MKGRIGILTVAIVGLVLVASPAMAAKGGNGKGHGGAGTAPVQNSIILNETAPRFGDYVSFTVSYPNTVKDAYIRVNCSQNGQLVYGEGGTSTSSFKLGGDSSLWVNNGGGAADCQAGLYYFQGGLQTWLAWTPFAAAA
jgi:hypothetical protein